MKLNVSFIQWIVMGDHGHSRGLLPCRYKEATMAKIRSLSFSGSNQQHTQRFAGAFFTAACEPFGSLIEIADELWESLERYLAKGPGKNKEEAYRMFDLVMGVGDQTSRIEFGMWEVTFTTPTSGTKIKVQRFGGGMEVGVTFPQPSRVRAEEILHATRNVEDQQWEIEFEE
jgi:hypothetical protein